jgi:hypothetical protein
VPAVVGIALGSNFAMLKAVAHRHPQRLRQALQVLGQILSSLEPLSLRHQKQTQELNQLQTFLAQLAATDSAPASASAASPSLPAAESKAGGDGVDRGAALEAMLSLALTRGTIESALSAAGCCAPTFHFPPALC